MTAAGRVLAVACGLLVAVTGCTGDDPDLDPEEAAPTRRPGPPTPVEVCGLLPVADVSEALGRRASVVDAGYTDAGLPTFRCGFGTRPGAARVTVTLAPGPIAMAVFDAAYGEQAGGDPQAVERLGERAYLRDDAGARSVAVFISGSVLQVTGPPDPADAVHPRQLLELARTAVDRLPRHPMLDVPPARPPCAAVSDRLVAGALGAPARLSSALLGPDDSVVCSWASLPGSVTATVLTGHRPRVAAERALRGDEGPAVRVLPGALGWSGADRPGDLVVLVGGSTVLRLDVVPVAGWADDDVPTTRAEIALARDLVQQIR